MPQVDQAFIDEVWRLISAVDGMPDAEGAYMHRYDEEFSELIAMQTAVRASLKRMKLEQS